MKRYDDNLEIELSWGPCTKDIRYYYCRVNPKVLSLWDRLFNNRWRQLEHGIYDNWNPCFSINEYHNLLKPLKTVGDVRRYYEIETAKIEKVRKDYIDKRIVFPDEYNKEVKLIF